MTNPYHSSQKTGPSSEPAVVGAEPLASLKWPGFGLTVVSMLSVVYLLVRLFVCVLVGGSIGLPGFVDSFLGAVGLVAIYAFVLFAGKLIQRGRNYRACMAGAIIACIPILSPGIVLGVPFGIWAILVLQRPAVKLAFKQTEI